MHQVSANCDSIILANHAIMEDATCIVCCQRFLNAKDIFHVEPGPFVNLFFHAVCYEVINGTNSNSEPSEMKKPQERLAKEVTGNHPNTVRSFSDSSEADDDHAYYDQLNDPPAT